MCVFTMETKRKSHLNFINRNIGKRKIPEKLLAKYRDDLDLDKVAIYQKLSDEFIKQNFLCFKNYHILLAHQKVPLILLDQYHFLFDYFDWMNISKFQSLTETYMDKYNSRLYWKFISRFQRMTFTFIQKHIDKLVLEELFLNKKITLTQREKEELRDLKFVYNCFSG